MEPVARTIDNLPDRLGLPEPTTQCDPDIVGQTVYQAYLPSSGQRYSPWESAGGQASRPCFGRENREYNEHLVWTICRIQSDREQSLDNPDQLEICWYRPNRRP